MKYHLPDWVVSRVDLPNLKFYQPQAGEQCLASICIIFHIPHLEHAVALRGIL